MLRDVPAAQPTVYWRTTRAISKIRRSSPRGYRRRWASSSTGCFRAAMVSDVVVALGDRAEIRSLG
jgi:hypothetical protein